MYSRAMKSLSAVIGDQDPSLLSSRLRTRGAATFYQVRIGADTRPDADNLCNRIRKAGGACFVLRNGAAGLGGAKFTQRMANIPSIDWTVSAARRASHRYRPLSLRAEFQEIEMGTVENKETIRRIYAALEKGDRSVFGASVQPDYVWRLAGQSSWSKRFAGQEDVRTNLLKPLFALFATEYRARAVNLVAEGDQVVAEIRGDVQTQKRQALQQRILFCVHLSRRQDRRDRRIWRYRSAGAGAGLLRGCGAAGGGGVKAAPA